MKSMARSNNPYLGQGWLSAGSRRFVVVLTEGREPLELRGDYITVDPATGDLLVLGFGLRFDNPGSATITHDAVHHSVPKADWAMYWEKEET